MNREPPKNVYSNNRLRKIEPVTLPINNKRQSSHQYTSAVSSGMTENSIAVTKDRSLHFNKSQSKYEKHFEPSSPKILNSKKLKESPHVKKVLSLKLKNPPTLGDLGIPLKHSYVQRKITCTNHCSMQPVSKKSRKNLDSSELQSNLLCVHRDQSSDNPLWLSPQESPNQLIEKSNPNDPHDASEFFQMVKATLYETFEEIVKDCPEFLTTTSNAKEKLLKKLRSYTQRQQTMLGDHAKTEDSGESDILLNLNRPREFNRFPGESSTESRATKPKLQLNNATPTTVVTTDAWAPVAYGFKSYTTPREFLPRSRRYTGSITNVSERMPSDAVQISSKGSSVQVNGSVSLNQSCSKNNLEEADESTHACLPMYNPRKERSGFWTLIAFTTCPLISLFRTL
ncbi:hypothetical protein GHT06_020745 [Daphnia sinensis]|uniref:Uncharacterized protein n=1 Tax=Daphnia sinensis TaxID=1820382 RepID=A0AAD5KI64_9CRUS|nr:hypothetical protein GHT06_020745 [Daphnia sinensis]